MYSKRLGDPLEDSPDDSYVTMPIYVDDGRIYNDPTEGAPRRGQARPRAAHQGVRDRVQGDRSEVWHYSLFHLKI
jgi:hypothetical protein